MSDLRQQLATARAFAKAAQQAPLVTKARAVEQMVLAMLDSIEAVIQRIEEIEAIMGGNV